MSEGLLSIGAFSRASLLSIKALRAYHEAGILVPARVHPGYDSIDDTYRQLGAWVGLHATPADQPVREAYVVSYGDVDDPSQFRTEIQWPIADEETPS